MDGVQHLLSVIREQKLAKGRLRGVFHLLIGCKLATADGTVLSSGLTWRQLAKELKDSRLDKNLVTELGADPDTLSPRDRERFWYAAITLGMATGEGGSQAAELLKMLKPHGFSKV
ncbi:hypothetical protein BH11PLA2_BH11PLA2_14740 [soil metagenome]